jgi:hypothetical protein
VLGPGSLEGECVVLSLLAMALRPLAGARSRRIALAILLLLLHRLPRALLRLVVLPLSVLLLVGVVVVSGICGGGRSVACAFERRIENCRPPLLERLPGPLAPFRWR